MIPAAVVFAYLGDGARHRHLRGPRVGAAPDAEDYFLAGRSLGPAVFLLSLFGANMTAFSILGASGHAFANGIVTYGLMASSSALVIPLSLFVIGTRLWALGKRHGFMTPVQMFRDRWECGHIGTVIFAVQAVLLVPYIIIAVMGGGTTLRAVSSGLVPFWLGGAVVSLGRDGLRVLRRHARHGVGQRVPDGAVPVVRRDRRGGDRAPAWADSAQAMESMLASPATAPLLTRERVSPLYFLQLHVHPAVVDRLSAHRHLLPDRAPARAFPQDDRALPDLHARDLAAVGVSRRRRQPRDRRAGDQRQARGAGDAGRRRARR